MEKRDNEKDFCPHGHQDCPFLKELKDMRERCARLSRQVETDALTGLFNYHHLLKALDVEMERSRRTGLPTALIMVDLDHFKRVNDTYGHEVGNKVLQHVASIWKHQTRRLDIPCRYGGEEFAIVLPNTRFTMAVHTAERLRKALGKTVMQFNSHTFTVTGSFGVDVYDPKEKCSVEEFIDRVDKYLMEAKSRGRNQVCHRETLMAKITTDLTQEERAALLGGEKR